MKVITLYSRQSALPAELPRQLSRLGPNPTSHSVLLINRLSTCVNSMSCHISCIYTYMFLMRDEKEGRKKQARSNKQQGKATQHTQGSRFS